MDDKQIEEYSINYYASQVELGNMEIRDVPIPYKTKVRIILKQKEQKNV